MTVAVAAQLLGTRTPPPVLVTVSGVPPAASVRVLREVTGEPPALLRGGSVPAAGAELAANPTLATDATGWAARWFGTTGAGSSGRDAAAARTGTHGFRKTWTAGAGASSSDTGISYGSTGATGDTLAIVAGSRYRLAMWLRASRATTFRPVIQWYTAAGATVGAAEVGASIAAPAATWVRVAALSTAPTGAQRVNFIAGPRYVDAATAPAAWQAGDTLDADDASIGYARTVLVGDVEAPLGRVIVYAAEVTDAEGAVATASTSITVTDPGRHALSDPATGRAVLVDVVATPDERTAPLRATTLHVAGRPRPIALIDARSADTGALTVYTRDRAETLALAELLAAGSPLVSRSGPALVDLPPVEVLLVTEATRTRRTRAGDRVWSLPFLVVDSPDPTLPVTLVTLANLATYYTAATLTQISLDHASLLALARADLGTG